MREQLEKRIAELRTEFDAGQKMLADLEQKRDSLQQTLLRISGAIQVLDELLADESAPGAALASSPNGAQAGTPASMTVNDDAPL